MFDEGQPDAPLKVTALRRAKLSVKNLHTYFNDHLAGSVAALSLAGDLEKSKHSEFATFIRSLKRQIEEDQRLLKALIDELGGEESSVKAATAWLGEKLAAVKLELHPQEEDPLGTMEALEVLALGIEGKKLMWILLNEIGFNLAVETPLDLNQLAQKAAIQREDVERWRKWWGKLAFVSKPT